MKFKPKRSLLVILVLALTLSLVYPFSSAQAAVSSNTLSFSTLGFQTATLGGVKSVSSIYYSVCAWERYGKSSAIDIRIKRSGQPDTVITKTISASTAVSSFPGEPIIPFCDKTLTETLNLNVLADSVWVSLSSTGAPELVTGTVIINSLEGPVPGTILTVAGNGQLDFSGDGGQAISAGLHTPRDVEFDAFGNIYFIDSYNGKIRKINKLTGIITTLAPVMAKDITIDKSTGNIYATTGTAVYKVSPTGTISLLIKDLNGAYGIALDSKGNLYVSESSTQFLLKYSQPANIVLAVGKSYGVPIYVGDVAEPSGIHIDQYDNIYVAGKTKILKLELNSRRIVAGIDISGNSEDNGNLATEAKLDMHNMGGFQGAGIVDSVYMDTDAEGNLYIADSGNNKIRKVSTDGKISTIAGSVGKYGLPFFTSPTGLAVLEGVEAITSMTTVPSGIKIDGSGNMYITADNRIRKIASWYYIKTEAGTGTAGFSGEGGPATSALLNLPKYLTADVVSGGVYIGGFYGTNRIMKVSADGKISTVAGLVNNGDGAQALNAVFEYISDIDVDNQDNIYISDFNKKIRKIDSATGIITTVGGNGEYGVPSPSDGALATSSSISSRVMAVDSVGNVYFVDGYKIRKINKATGTITTVAGSGGFGAPSDGVPALQSNMFGIGSMKIGSDGNLYISDVAIRKIDLTAGTITRVAGTNVEGYSGDGGPALQATFGEGLGGIAFNSAGDIYVADSFNNRIRKVTKATGIITTVAGISPPEEGAFSGDGGSAINAELSSPRDVAMDSDGNIYIDDNGNDRIRKINPQGIIETVAGDPDSATYSDGIAFTNNIGSGGHVILDSKKNIYIVSQGNLRKISMGSDGIRRITTVAGQNKINEDWVNGRIATSVPFSAHGLDYDQIGNLYVRQGTYIRKIYPSGTVSTLANIPNIMDVAVDPQGKVYATTRQNKIIRIDSPTIFTTVAGTGTSGYSGDGGLATNAMLSYPTMITADASGNLYYIDWGYNNYRIRKIYMKDTDTNGDGTPEYRNGYIYTIMGNGVRCTETDFQTSRCGEGGLATSARLDNPADIATDKDGNLYIINSAVHRLVLKVSSSDGKITRIAGTGRSTEANIENGKPALLSDINPLGVALSSSGNIYVTTGNVVGRLFASSTIPSPLVIDNFYSVMLNYWSYDKQYRCAIDKLRSMGYTVKYENVPDVAYRMPVLYPPQGYPAPNIPIKSGSLPSQLLDIECRGTTISSLTAPFGIIEGQSGTDIVGWAYDADIPTTPVQVKLVGTPTTSGTAFSITVTADKNRADLVSGNYLPSGNSNHGFVLSATSGIAPGTYTVKAFAVDSATNQEKEILDSPKTVTVASSQPSESLINYVVSTTETATATDCQEGFPGGRSYSTKDKVTYNSNVYQKEDTCLTSTSPNRLLEYFCSNGNIVEEQVECKTGCSNGKCNSALSTSGTINVIGPNPCQIKEGQTTCQSTVAWSATNAPRPTLCNQNGVVSATSDGSQAVTLPVGDYVYTLYSDGCNSDVLASTTLKVLPPIACSYNLNPSSSWVNVPSIEKTGTFVVRCDYDVRSPCVQVDPGPSSTCVFSNWESGDTTEQKAVYECTGNSVTSSPEDVKCVISASCDTQNLCTPQKIGTISVTQPSCLSPPTCASGSTYSTQTGSDSRGCPVYSSCQSCPSKPSCSANTYTLSSGSDPNSCPTYTGCINCQSPPTCSQDQYATTGVDSYGCPTRTCTACSSLPTCSASQYTQTGTDTNGCPTKTCTACPSLPTCTPGQYEISGTDPTNGCSTKTCANCQSLQTCQSNYYSQQGTDPNTGCLTNSCQQCSTLPNCQSNYYATTGTESNGCPTKTCTACPSLPTCSEDQYATTGTDPATGCATKTCTACQSKPACASGSTYSVLTGSTDTNGCSTYTSCQSCPSKSACSTNTYNLPTGSADANDCPTYTPCQSCSAPPVCPAGKEIKETNIDLNGCKVFDCVMQKPTNLNYACGIAGRSVTLSWDSITGINSYLLRVNDPTNDNPIAQDGWLVAGTTDLSKTTSGQNPTTYTDSNINCGKTYNWWVHSTDGTVNSDATNSAFTCACPQSQLSLLGDGGLGLYSKLSMPYDVFVDPRGDVYIADTFNNRVRKIDKTTGIITTVAGSGDQGFSGEADKLATESNLNQPSGVSVFSGTVYITDTNNHRIRKLYPLT